MATKIKMKRGYPTTDGIMHDKFNDAMRHQVDLDLIEVCSESEINIDDLKEFLKVNKGIITDYIKRNLK